jgi:hypothetical protein
MDEARIREIVREEMEAADVLRVEPMTPAEFREQGLKMAGHLAKKLVTFQREFASGENDFR